MNGSAPSGGSDEAVVFEVAQHRFRPLLRWAVLALATLVGAVLFVALLRHGLPPRWPWRVGMLALGLTLFVTSLATVSGLLNVAPGTWLRRSRVRFAAGRAGLSIERPARGGSPLEIDRDEVVGPFVRIDDAIDAEASAATVLRAGGEEMALMLAEGARAASPSADTLIGWLHTGSDASVTVTWRGRSVVLAEALSRREAENLGHAVERALHGIRS